MDFKVSKLGFVTTPDHRWPCALGRGGIHPKLSEGDGITPTGTYGLGRVFWRDDRINRPITALPITVITPYMGWSDDPAHEDYNTLVHFPHSGRYESLHREDHLYDLLVEVLFNSNPIIRGSGSAIFMHVARPDYAPTEGCIALNINDLLELLRFCNENSRLII